MDKGLANPICTERRGLVWPNIFLVTIFSSWFLNSMSWTLCTWFNDSDTWVSGSRRGRVVKASDLKSDSLWERRFESCRLRDFCKKNSHLHRLIMKSHNYHVCIVAVVAEWLRRLTRNQIPSGSVGSSPTDCDISFKLHFNYWVIIKKITTFVTLDRTGDHYIRLLILFPIIVMTLDWTIICPSIILLKGAWFDSHEPYRKITTCRDPGSNRGPLDLQSNALPTELSRQISHLNFLSIKFL